MLGAMVGDIVGSVYEFATIKTKDFPLFDERSARRLGHDRRRVRHPHPGRHHPRHRRTSQTSARVERSLVD